MISRLLSFRSFLRTGTLGPLTVELSPVEVGAMLGVPDSWIVSGDDVAPGYWIYGDHLEISFDVAANRFGSGETPRMIFFQIENAMTLAGDCAVLVDNAEACLVLALEGLSGASPVSAYLEAMSCGAEPAQLVARPYATSEDWQVTAVAGAVEAIFTSSDAFDAADGDGDASALAHAIERDCRIDCIYVFADRDAFGRRVLRQNEERRTRVWTAGEFGALVDGDGRESAA